MAEQTPAQRDAQLRRRKRVARNLSLAGAGVGVAALGSKAAEGVLRLKKLPTAAAKVSSHTNNALVLGTGVGAAGALNSAAIANQEAKSKKPLIKSYSSDKIVNPVYMLPGSDKKRSGLPTVKSTTKGTLKMISAKSNPSPSVFSSGVPGGKTLNRIDRTVNKGLVRGAKAGYAMAGRSTPALRQAARRGEATTIAGRKAGAAAHDFKAGYSRHIHATPDIEAGKTTTRATAAYPGWHRAGNLTRKATPVAVLGGAAYGGNKLGQSNQRKKQTVTKSHGVLTPISKRSAYDSEHDRHTRNGMYAGGLAAGAVGAGALGVNQGLKAKKTVAINRRAGKLTSVRVPRAGLKHGGKAAGALVVAGGLGAAANKVTNKSRTRGDWY